MLRQARKRGLSSQWSADINKIPFLDERAFQTRFFSPENDVVVYSTLMDMTHGLYRQRKGDLIVAWGDFLLDLTDPANWPELTARKPYLTHDFLEWFREHFVFTPGLSDEQFRANLLWLCEQTPARQIILLNGSEVPLDHPLERERWRHHARLNAVVEDVEAVYTRTEPIFAM